MGVTRGVDTQPRPLEEATHPLQRVGGVGGGAADHQVRGLTSWGRQLKHMDVIN